LQQQVEEQHEQLGEQEQEHKALHEAQQQLAEVQQFFVQELEQLVQQRAQEQRERVVEQQQFAEVLQFLQGQRELIKDLEEELRVLEARSREQEQAMFELDILKQVRAFELLALVKFSCKGRWLALCMPQECHSCIAFDLGLNAQQIGPWPVILAVAACLPEDTSKIASEVALRLSHWS